MVGILYILILKDNQAFKVGITNNDNLNRVKQLHGRYEFNLDESYIVTADSDKTTKMLERQIHSDYHCYHHEFDHKNDGYTEFIKIEHLNSILSDIEHKAKLRHLNIEIKKGIDIKPIISRLKGEFEYIGINDANNVFDLLISTINIFKEKITFEKINLNNFTHPKYALISKDIDALKTLVKISKFYYGKPNKLGGYWNYHNVFTHIDYNNEYGYLILDKIRRRDDEYYDIVYQPLLSSFYLNLNKLFNSNIFLISQKNKSIIKFVNRNKKYSRKKNWFKCIDNVTTFDDLLFIILENKYKMYIKSNNIEHRLYCEDNGIARKLFSMTQFKYGSLDEYEVHRIFSSMIKEANCVSYLTIDKIISNNLNDINLMKYNKMLLDFINVLMKELKPQPETIYPNKG